MIRLNGKNKLIRCLSLITTLLYSLQLFAAPEDHGRWYSLDDDSSSSSMSPIGFIIGGVIIVFLGYLLLSVDKANKEKTGKENSGFGCDVWAIIGGIVCIIIGFAKCGN